jgi:signal transduction histidine kinase
VDLRDVIARSARALEVLIQARGQHLLFVPPAEPVIASVDAERLGRVLRNLVGNAQKHGREHGTIAIALERGATEVCIAVTDDGPGIPRDDLERIFERCYRVRGTGSAGSGLGLAIARALVELHGGRVWVESTPGHGSTFRISLPSHA